MGSDRWALSRGGAARSVTARQAPVVLPGVPNGRAALPPFPLVKLTLLADDHVRYEPAPGPLTVEAPSAETQFSPFHMLGGSLASCTFSVLAAWAQNARIPIDDLVIDVTWTFAEKPHRVGEIALRFAWPSLPENRLKAAERAAALCTVHATLAHPPRLVTVAARDAGAGVVGTPAAAAVDATRVAPGAGDVAPQARRPDAGGAAA